MSELPEDDRADYQEVDIALIEATGKMCIGLGQAIAGLSKLNLSAEAQELAVQLKYASRSLTWMLRPTCDRHHPSIESGRSTTAPRFPKKGA